MPSTSGVERPQEAVNVANQYRRRERPLSAIVVVLAVSLFVGTYVATSLLPAVGVAVILIVVARTPILKPHGTVRLRTEDGPAIVREAFTGPMPPVLALQWGPADEVITDDGTVTYPISYLFGLRSAEVSVHAKADTTPDGEYRVELTVTTNGRPWGTYDATISEEKDATVVDVEYEADRRFGLRRLPQQFVARRYRDDALAAQGYTVVERDARVGV